MEIDAKDSEWRMHQRSKEEKALATVEAKRIKSMSRKKKWSLSKPTCAKKKSRVQSEANDTAINRAVKAKAVVNKSSQMGDDICPRCGIGYHDQDMGDWISCRSCKTWVHMICEGVDNEEAPSFICSDCFSEK